MRRWTSLAGNMQNYEFYPNFVSYDSVSHVIQGGGQDTGTARQISPNGPLANDLTGGDGGATQVDARYRAGFSIVYARSQGLGNFQRITYNRAGQRTGERNVGLTTVSRTRTSCTSVCARVPAKSCCAPPRTEGSTR